MSRLPNGADNNTPETAQGRRDGQVERPRRTSETRTTLSNGLEPESLYTPGFFKGTDTRGSVTSTFDDKKDISKTAVESAVDYAGRLTQGDVSHQGSRRINKSNAFAVDKKAEVIGENSLTLTSPSPVDRAASQLKRGGKTLGSFIDVARELNSSQANRFESTSNSNYGRADSSDNPFTADPPAIDKKSGVDGHTLLPSITSNEQQSRVGAPVVFDGAALEGLAPVQKKISSVLKENRFNSSNNTPFMRDHERITESVRGKNFTRMGATKQEELGKYIKDAKFILEEDLKAVGGELLSAATGQEDIDFSLSGLAALAKRASGLTLISTSDMRAANTASGEKVLSDGASVKTEILATKGSSRSTKSFGTLTSPDEPFSGPLPISMVVNTIAGMVPLLGFAGIIAYLGFNPKKEELGSGIIPTETHPKDMALGRHSLKSAATKDYLLKLFRIPAIENEFELCLAAGILAFYGLEEVPSLFDRDLESSVFSFAGGGNLVTDLLNSVQNIVNSAGYYTIITRAAGRDARQIKDALSGFNISSVGSNIVQLFKLVDSVIESTTWKFLMIMASVGDKILSSLDGHPTLGGDVGPSGVVDPATRYYANRDLEGRLSWRHAALPAKYVLPEVFQSAHTKAIAAGKFNVTQLSLEDLDTEMGEKIVRTSRISKLDANLIENDLDAEYVPFYFHDIRTNEIIAFHAFLSNLSDSYNADYASTSAYGRGDDIKVYNKTSRAITVRMTMAATSREDLDVMYWNLNKLVSMVYPQWSRGRSVVNGTGPNAEKFIQPFSQIPTASPLIRIRLGDVLKTNYSKFGLMRLFGLGEGEDDFTLDKSPATVSKDKQDASEKELKETENKLKKAIAFRKVDPGSDDAQQKQILAGEGFKDADVVDNTQFGYKIGDIIYINQSGAEGTGQGYWPRDNTGKLAKNFRKIPERQRIAKLAVNYRSPAEVEIVRRVPDGAHSSQQNEVHFSKHVPASDIGAEKTRDEKARADGQNYFGTMAYLVKIIPGSKEDILLSTKKVDKSMRYHRVTHDMIRGLSPAGVKKIKETVTPPVPDVRTEEPGRLVDFFSSKNNFLVRSFESAMGRGLAGFITSLEVDWKLNESTWETDRGAIAPKLLEVSFNFSPIHDIPMGLDSSGMMRSVAYNVGEFSKTIGQDSIPDNTELLEESMMRDLEAETSTHRSTENQKKSDQITDVRDKNISSSSGLPVPSLPTL